MFWNIYSKRILSSLRDKETLIWTWAFPIMLATLFYFAFTNIDIAGQFTKIPVGVVDNEAYRQDHAFQFALASVSTGAEGSLFDLTVFADTQEADTALEDGDIYGYILVDDAGPALMVSRDGPNQTIAKGFLDGYLRTGSGLERVLSHNPQALEQLDDLARPAAFTREIALSDNPPTDVVNYFYALIALICLYGGFQGLFTVSGFQANLSALGARRTMLPGSRFRMMAYDVLGGVTMQFICLVTVLGYIMFVLGVDFGPRLWPVLLTCFVGSVLGIALGALVGVTSKLKESAKIAILIAISMVCAFLSGLMVGGVNYTVMQRAPAVAWLNPAARITDAFYSLYFFDTLDRYFLNIGIISAMAVVMLIITAFFVRRDRYESI